MSFGLMRDKAMRHRAVTSSDSEGNTNLHDTADLVVWGTWGAPSDTDVESAARRAESLDAVFAFSSIYDVVAGDRLDVKGDTYNVLEVVDARLHSRAKLRLIG